MAIKRIERYGKFSSPTLDRSGEVRMRALAGLGQGIVALGEGLQERKRTELLFEAPTVGLKEGEKAFETGEYKASLGAGASKRASAAQASYIASFDNLFAKVIEDTKKTAQDSNEFLNLTQAALDGLMQGYSNLPDIWLNKAQTNAQQLIQTNVAPMIKAETDVAVENNKLEFNASEQSQIDLQSTLAFQGDTEGLQLARQNQSLAHNLAFSLGIKSTDVDTLKPEHIENLQYQYFRGVIQRAVLDNDSLTLEQKINGAQNKIDELRLRDSVVAINPDDPTTTLRISKETQQKFVDKLQKELKTFADKEKAKVEQNTLADQVQNAQRKSDFTDEIMNSELDIDELLVKVSEEEVTTGADYSSITKYLNSVNKLNAQSNPKLTGEIIAQIYDLNADMGLEMDGSRYLNGMQNIKNKIMEERAKGRLSKSNEVSLLQQIKQLTSAKTAEATTLLASNWYKASSIVKKSVAPEDYGMAIRGLHFIVEEAKAQYRLENNGAEPTQQMIQAYWNEGAVVAANQINEMKRNQVTEKLNRRQKNKLPVIKTKDEYDALKKSLGVGVRYYNAVKGVVEVTQ